MRRRLITILLLVLAGPASAQWVYQSEESAFGSGGTQIMLAPAGYKTALGLRCLKEKSPEIVYMTNDSSFDADTTKVANMTTPKLMLRIDDNDPQELDSTILLTDDGTAMFVAEANKELLNEIGGAKKRVAIAVGLLGETYHENKVGVRGTRKNVDKLISDCKL